MHTHVYTSLIIYTLWEIIYESLNEIVFELRVNLLTIIGLRHNIILENIIYYLYYTNYICIL